MKIIVCHSALTNGTAGFLISPMTCSETAVPIRIGSIPLYFPDRLFGEDRRWQQSGARLSTIHNLVYCITMLPLVSTIRGYNNLDYHLSVISDSFYSFQKLIFSL